MSISTDGTPCTSAPSIPVQKTKRKCIIHCCSGTVYTDLRNISPNAYSKIKTFARIREELPDTSELHFAIINNLPSEVNPALHGMHRKCYNAFSSNGARLERKRQAQNEVTIPIKACRRSNEALPSERTGKLHTRTIWKKQCLFCDKMIVRCSKNKLERLTKCSTKTGENEIKKSHGKRIPKPPFKNS